MAKKDKQEKPETGVYDELRGSAHKIWLAGLGAMSAAEQEGSKFFKQLVERGEVFETKSRERFDEARTKAGERLESVGEKLTGSLEEQIAKAMKRLGVPSRSEIESLAKKIDQLGSKVDALAGKAAGKTGGGAKKASARKKPAPSGS